MAFVLSIDVLLLRYPVKVKPVYNNCQNLYMSCLSWVWSKPEKWITGFKIATCPAC